MDLSAEMRALHADLSPAQERFLDFVERNPGCLDRATFQDVEDLDKHMEYATQSWPTFVRRGKLEELARASIEVCRLIRAIPRRVFGNDPQKLMDFYGLDVEHARLASAAMSNEKMMRNVVARPDFVLTENGFQCVECNMVPSLGGWDGAYKARTLLGVPEVARFVRENDVTPHFVHVFRRALMHILDQAVERFGETEINIAFLFPERMAKYQMLGVAAAEEYKLLLAQYPGVSGQAVTCNGEDFQDRDGEIYHGDTHIHVLVETIEKPSPLFVYRAWVRGSLILYNGPPTPLLTDKRNIAILSELADSEIFSEGERQMIHRAVPWSRRVSDVPIHPTVREPLTPSVIEERRAELVLKASEGTGGEGVFMGAATPPDEWAKLVERAFDEGDWLAQQRLQSLRFYYQAGDSGACLHDVVWACFVIGDKFGGTYLRAMPAGDVGIVNAGQGAREAVVLEVDEEED